MCGPPGPLYRQYFLLGRRLKSQNFTLILTQWLNGQFHAENNCLVTCFKLVRSEISWGGGEDESAPSTVLEFACKPYPVNNMHCRNLPHILRQNYTLSQLYLPLISLLQTFRDHTMPCPNLPCPKYFEISLNFLLISHLSNISRSHFTVSYSPISNTFRDHTMPCPNLPSPKHFEIHNPVS